MTSPLFYLLLLTSLATLSAAMLCPECQKLGQKSRVTPHGGSSTTAFCGSYYDEDGHYVTSKCNTCMWSYSCSNGHHWSVKESC